MKKEAPLEKIRHTLAHLLAASVLELFPGSENSIGPAIENGFYQDFEMKQKISDTDLPKIEKKMREILKTWKSFERKEVDLSEVKKVFPKNKYKVEMAKEFVQEDKQLTLYTVGDFVDLCRGNHVEHPSHDINPDAFKLTHIAGAYWRGDEKNKMLTRIYGVAFNTKEELNAHLQQQEEAKKRDHRKLGKELDLFVFSDTVGKGLPLWTEKGSILRREIERFIIDEEIKRGYLHVYTPDIAKLDLYKKSGHYPYYKEEMYPPMHIDGEALMLRPMTCPHHFELYASKPHSYKELPMRIAELGKLYRYEQSGELSGLQRVRSFCLADAHIICKDKAQAVEEIAGALDLIEYVAGVFGLKMGENYSYRLSLGDRDNSEKYFQDDRAWEESEAALREMLQQRKCDFVEAQGEAAFYGPKIDVQMKNVNGKEDTAFTVQYDFCMPERFKLTYVDTDGSEKRPVVIHRSSVGSIERTIAFLIEHTAGSFPLWLSPVQVKILPIGEAHHTYAKETLERLQKHDIRAQLDASNETLGKKIRNWKLAKTPYALIIGDEEMKNKTVSVESRDKGKIGTQNIQTLIESLEKEIQEKK